MLPSSPFGESSFPSSFLLGERSIPPSSLFGERSFPPSSSLGEGIFPLFSLSMKDRYYSNSMPRKISNTLIDLSSCVAVFTGPEEATILVLTKSGGEIGFQGHNLK